MFKIYNTKDVFLAIGIPTYKTITGNFLDFICESIGLLYEHKINFIFINNHDDALVTRSRNDIISRFYELTKQPRYKKLTHFLFLDSDIHTSPHNILKLIENTQLYDIHLTGAYVPLKGFTDTIIQECQRFNLEREKKEVIYLDPDYKLQKVSVLTTGMLLFTTQLIHDLVRDAKINKFWYHNRERNSRVYDLFQTSIIEYPDENNNKYREYLSEDWYICNTAKKLGYDVIADHTITIWHRGNHDYHFPYNEDYPKIIQCRNILEHSQ